MVVARSSAPFGRAAQVISGYAGGVLSFRPMNYQESEIEPARDAFEHCVSRHSVGFVFGGNSQHLDTASGVALSWQKADGPP